VLEGVVDQLEGDRPDQQAGADSHDDRDHAAARVEQVGDERADEQGGRPERSPAECLKHLTASSRRSC
jgi:hypothetical protein